MVLPVSPREGGPGEIEALFGARTAEILPDRVGPDAARALRAAHEPRYTRYRNLDRGSYDVIEDAPVLLELVDLVCERLGRALAIASSRVLRFHPGDYLLAHADRVYDDHPIEVIIDISEAAIPGAEVHYRRRGQVYFRVPSQPGSLAIVERGPTVTSNHTYVSKLHTGTVVREVLLLRDPDRPRPHPFR